MTNRQRPRKDDHQKWCYYRNGKLYFNKKTERNFFFVMTLLMLVLGILAKMDFF
jgi:hypothetical protein